MNADFKNKYIRIRFNQRASALIRVPFDVEAFVSYVEPRNIKTLSGRGSNLMNADLETKSIQHFFWV